MSLLRVFSGSCLSLDDHDYSMPRLVARKHVLGSGEDLFDEGTGRPKQPQPRTLTKVFSGSALDLNAQGDSDSDVSHSVSPALVPSDRTQQSFNDFVDGVNRGREQGTGNSRTMVLVIGGAGYLASHVIEQLLRAGYQVRATVADMRDSGKVHDLYQIVPEAKHMLFVVEADVFSATSLRGAMSGCRYVMHCGVPPLSAGTDLVDGHLEAVMALFDAVRTSDIARSRRIERVVLTGSYTNVVGGKANPSTSSGKFDESQWNDTATRDSDALAFARVTFEKEAARLAKMVKVELTIVLPAIMIGPVRTMEVSEAMRTITDFASCSPLFPVAPNIYWNFVDVRDVATAQVKAMTAPNADGERFIVANRLLSLAELGRLIRKSYPHLTAPIYTAPNLLSLATAPWSQSRASMSYLWRTLGVRRELDGSKAQSQLQLTITDMDSTVADAVASLIMEGHLPDAAHQPASARASRTLVALAVGLGAVGVAVAAWSRTRAKQ